MNRIVRILFILAKGYRPFALRQPRDHISIRYSAGHAGRLGIADCRLRNPKSDFFDRITGWTRFFESCPEESPLSCYPVKIPKCGIRNPKSDPRHQSERYVVHRLESLSRRPQRNCVYAARREIQDAFAHGEIRFRLAASNFASFYERRFLSAAISHETFFL